MTRTYSLSTTNNPWLIGFEDVFDRISNVQTTSSNYPPYNIIKTDSYNYVIELAVAGFKRSDLDVEVADGILIVKGEVEESPDTENEYVHRGLAKRAFTRRFTLADDVVVENVKLEDGVMTISLKRIVPDHKLPKKFDIL
jgi:molecular chaperone IbpA